MAKYRSRTQAKFNSCKEGDYFYKFYVSLDEETIIKIAILSFERYSYSEGIRLSLNVIIIRISIIQYLTRNCFFREIKS